MPVTLPVLVLVTVSCLLRRVSSIWMFLWRVSKNKLHKSFSEKVVYNFSNFNAYGIEAQEEDQYEGASLHIDPLITLSE